MDNAKQLDRETIQGILPYLEWIDMFREVKFQEYFAIPIPAIEYTLRSSFSDVGYLQWYSRKIGKMISIPFCQEERTVLGKPLIKSTIGHLLHQVNVQEDLQYFYYIYRIRKGKVRDAIRITFKRLIDKTDILPKGFHLSRRYVIHNDIANIADIERYMENTRSITILTTQPKHEKRIRMINPLIDSSIVFKGVISPDLLQICENYGYKRTSKKTENTDGRDTSVNN